MLSFTFLSRNMGTMEVRSEKRGWKRMRIKWARPKKSKAETEETLRTISMKGESR